VARTEAAAIDMITNSGDFPRRRHEVETADVALTEQCMRAAGVPWKGGVNAVNEEAALGGSVSTGFVREHGYGLSDGKTEEPGSSGADHDPRTRPVLLGPADDLVRLQGPAEVVYLYPRTGCAAQAHAQLYGDLDTWGRVFYLPQELNLTLHSRALADPRYTATLSAWSHCMREKGFSYASPSELVTELTEQYRGSRQPLADRRAKEITLALTDLDCNKKIRLAATGLELRREFAARLEPAEGREMNRLAARFAEAHQRATAGR
jgi:hypothetical protein